MAIRKKPNYLDTVIIPFLKKYGIFIIGLFVLFPIAYKYFRNMIESVKNTNMQAEKVANANENGKADPVITKAKVAEIKEKYPKLSNSVMATITASARGIAEALGTNVEDNHIVLNGTLEMFNVIAWKEDEKKAMTFLKKHTGTFPILEEVYYKTATRSRNLVSDLLKYLSNKQLEEMRAFYKKAGYTWF